MSFISYGYVNISPINQMQTLPDHHAIQNRSCRELEKLMKTRKKERNTSHGILIMKQKSTCFNCIIKKRL